MQAARWRAGFGEGASVLAALGVSQASLMAHGWHDRIKVLDTAVTIAAAKVSEATSTPAIAYSDATATET